jgi:hypothetical protein
LLRLVTEANRIKLAHYFDPYLAIHTSLVDPLPHQISAVYGEMLPRQPLRFLLADDPGAGKTIMAGLLMKELIARSDLERCLVVAPGSLVEQWQDELGQKFNLEFDILSRDMIENSRSGNPFSDRDRLIVRLDVLARNEELQEKLMSAREWDLIICDEAHRMSATYFGGEVKYAALSGRPEARPGLPASAVDVGDAAQRQGRGFPALHGAARRRSVRGPVPRWCPLCRHRRHDAAADQGGTAQVRRSAALPRAAGAHGQISALGRRPRSTPPSPNMCAPR